MQNLMFGTFCSEPQVAHEGGFIGVLRVNLPFYRCMQPENVQTMLFHRTRLLLQY
jgi:hypothetical protein